MRRKNYFLLAFLLIHFFASTQNIDDEEVLPPDEAVPVENVQEYDDEYDEYEDEVEKERLDYPREERSFGGSLSNEYNGRDFDYTETPPKPKSNTDWSWLYNILRAIGSFFAAVGPYIMYAMIIIAGLFLVYLLLKALFDFNLNQVSFLQRRKIARATKKLNTDTEENTEDISVNDFPRLAERAESEGNYRLAFRYLFLDVLQRLNFRQYIDWQKNKTNLDYIPEIHNEKIQNEYKNLAQYFNYVWYGERAIDQSQYMHNKEEINQLKSSL